MDDPQRWPNASTLYLGRDQAALLINSMHRPPLNDQVNDHTWPRIHATLSSSAYNSSGWGRSPISSNLMSCNDWPFPHATGMTTVPQIKPAENLQRELESSENHYSPGELLAASPNVYQIDPIWNRVALGISQVPVHGMQTRIHPSSLNDVHGSS